MGGSIIKTCDDSLSIGVDMDWVGRRKGRSDGNPKHFGGIVVRGVGRRKANADGDDVAHGPWDMGVCGSGKDDGCGDFGGGGRGLESKLGWGDAHAAICVNVRKICGRGQGAPS